MRRRITDAWARLGSLTPGAGLAMRRSGGAGPGAGPGAGADRPGGGADQSAKPSATRNKVLIAGAGVLAVVAVGGVVIAPRLLGGSSDPGCKSYSGAALTAYNKTIDDLNAQASQTVLSADMSTAITDLTTSISQAQSDSVKTALNGLLTQLKTVQTDVKAGAVPTSTVNSLNAASTAADKAC